MAVDDGQIRTGISRSSQLTLFYFLVTPRSSFSMVRLREIQKSPSPVNPHFFHMSLLGRCTMEYGRESGDIPHSDSSVHQFNPAVPLDLETLHQPYAPRSVSRGYYHADNTSLAPIIGRMQALRRLQCP